MEKLPGKLVPLTACHKEPVKLCGTGCIFEEAEEQCHDILVQTVQKLPEEICNLDPRLKKEKNLSVFIYIYIPVVFKSFFGKRLLKRHK